MKEKALTTEKVVNQVSLKTSNPSPKPESNKLCSSQKNLASWCGDHTCNSSTWEAKAEGF
jgi:hypothetical protein